MIYDDDILTFHSMQIDINSVLHDGHCKKNLVCYRRTCIWGLWCQKRVSRVWMINCIPQHSVGCNYLSMPEIPASGVKVLISGMHDFRDSQWLKNECCHDANFVVAVPSKVVVVTTSGTTKLFYILTTFELQRFLSYKLVSPYRGSLHKEHVQISGFCNEYI